MATLRRREKSRRREVSEPFSGHTFEPNAATLFLKTLLMAGIYFLAGRASFEFFQQDAIVTVTPFAAEGFALAAALIFGGRIVPGIVLGQFLLALHSGLSWMPALAIGLVNGTEAYLAVVLFRRFSLERRLLDLRDVAGLVLMILLVLQPFSAIAGNLILLLFGEEGSLSFWENTFFWWFGNVMGQLIFTPLLLILYRDRHSLRWVLFLAVAVGFFLWNYLLQIVLGVESVAILLMATLPITLSLVAVDLVYAMFAAFVLTVANLYFTHLGIGAFAEEGSAVENLVNLNFFMLNHILLVLFFGTLYRQNREALKKLRSMAHYDHLTGLPNRHLLREELHHTLYLAERGERGAVCYIDLDGFKPVNDSFGHHVGDGVLREVVRRIERQIGPEDTLLRIGGDEFLAIFNRLKAPLELEKRLEKMLETVAEPIRVEGYEIEVSLSVGVAWCPDDGTSVEALMEASDRAMYEAKRAGKNRVRFASSTS